MRAWADTWSNDPLPGTYYLRVTAVDVPAADLGQPVKAAIEATSDGTAGKEAVDGSVAPVVSAGGPRPRPRRGLGRHLVVGALAVDPGGGLLAVAAALGAHRLARGPLGRTRAHQHQPPPPVRPQPPAGY